MSVGLWKRTKTGYKFHQWSERNATRTEVVTARQKKSSGGQFGNHRRWHVGKNVVDDECIYCPSLASANAPQASVDRSDSDRSTDEGENDSDKIGTPIGYPSDSASVSPKNAIGSGIASADQDHELGGVKGGSASGFEASDNRSVERWVNRSLPDAQANPPVQTRPEEIKGGSTTAVTHSHPQPPVENPEPPTKCLDHLSNPHPPRCWRCREAREVNDAWKAANAARLRDAPRCAKKDHETELASNCRICLSEVKGRVTREYPIVRPITDARSAAS